MAHNGSSPIKVLYIEDDKNIQYVISGMLTLLGYETVCADNGKLGVEKAKSWQPNVILTDLRMPVMDGPEAIQILRSDPDTAQIPIFVLSAWTDAKTRDLCKQVGVDRFFAKPPNIPEIDSAIQKTLKKGTDTN